MNGPQDNLFNPYRNSNMTTLRLGDTAPNFDPPPLHQGATSVNWLLGQDVVIVER